MGYAEEAMDELHGTTVFTEERDKPKMAKRQSRNGQSASQEEEGIAQWHFSHGYLTNGRLRLRMGFRLAIPTAKQLNEGKTTVKEVEEQTGSKFEDA